MKFLCLSFCLSASFSISQPVLLSVCQSVYLPVISLSVSEFFVSQVVTLSERQSFCLPAFLLLCLSVSLSVCLPVDKMYHVLICMYKSGERNPTVEKIDLLVYVLYYYLFVICLCYCCNCIVKLFLFHTVVAVSFFFYFLVAATLNQI